MAINFDSDTNQVNITVPSPTTVTVTKPADVSLTVTEKGIKGDKGDTGPQGIQGVPGADGADGQGVPTGGLEGQVIVKQSATDNDTAWDYVESVYLQIQNDEGSTLSAGTPVYAKGISGGSILVGKADANDSTKMPSIGVLLEETTNGSSGEIITAGLFNKTVSGLTGVSVGDTVFVSNTGTLTTTKPTASTDLLQNIGIVLQTNGSNIQKMKVSAIDRTNDIPNLDGGKFFIGGTTGQVSTYTLPTADGTTGQLLQTDGAGAVTFVDFSGSPWTTSGSDIYYTTGNVGVGTTTPAQPLHVNGTIRTVGSGYATDIVTHLNGGITIGEDISGIQSQAVNIGRSVGRFNAGTQGVLIGIQAGYRGSYSHDQVAIGRSSNSGGGAYSKTSAIGIGSVSNYNGGNYTTSVGANTGAASPSSYTNSAFFGYQAGHSGGNNSVFVGYEAGKSDGVQLVSNTVAVGYQALTALTTGASNTAVGYQSGVALTTGSSNTFFGTSAGKAKTTGYFNTIIGTAAGANSGATKQSQTLVGYAAGQYNNGESNSVLGMGALQYGSTSNSVAIGQQAIHIGGGGQDVGVGRQANRNSTGGNNVAVGYEAGKGVQSTSTFANTVAVGYQALTALTTGTQNTAVGYQAGLATVSNNNGTFLGYQAGLSTTGSSNTLIGNLAGSNITTGFNHTVVGGGAGAGLTTTRDSVAVGQGAMSSANSERAVAVGYSAGNSCGERGVHIGHTAGLNNSGTFCVNLGASAGATNVTTNSTVSIGRNSNSNAGGTISNAVAIGTSSKSRNNTVTIGDSAGNNTSTSSVFIGNAAGSQETNSNRLYIENSNSTTPLIYGEFDNDILRVNGQLEVTEGITVNKTADTDFSYNGDVMYFGSGSTTQGELCYLNSSGGWTAADADATGTAGGVMLAIALGTDPDADGMLLRGTFTLDHDPGTIGDELYVSTTAGDITSTAPSGTGDIVRVVGYCLDSTNGQIYFNPSNDFITLA